MQGKSLRAINLFSGRKSVATVLESSGFDVLTLDIDPSCNPDICLDIMEIDAERLGECDFLWASPPCECFSVASIGHHWNKDNTPKTERAARAIEIIGHTLKLIEEIKPRFWTMENPRGKLRKLMPEHLMRYTVTYCQYGDTRMKPTDLWGVFPDGWMPRACHNGASCHEKAPRGSKTGTQGIKGYHARSAVPEELVKSIVSLIR